MDGSRGEKGKECCIIKEMEKSELENGKVHYCMLS